MLLCATRSWASAQTHCWGLPAHKAAQSKPIRIARAGSDATTSAQQVQTESSTAPYSYILPRQAIAMFASGAVLGPFCDGLHSQYDVLHYEHPSVQLQLALGPLHWSFETCWWVPLLFGVAGVIIGVSVPLMDSILHQRSQEQSMQLPAQQAATSDQQQYQQQQGSGSTPDTSWSAVLLCISLFVIQYGLSGLLEKPLLGQTLGNTAVPALDSALAAYALLHWCAFDRMPLGFGMAALTAVCGPLVETWLINGFGLYHYSHAAVLGVPTWIPWVYFCGGPAVGHLGRRVWQELAADAGQQTHSA